MSDIKRCPFCGSSKVKVRKEYDDSAQLYDYFVECIECTGRGPNSATRDGAFACWDHRFRGTGQQSHG